eukprot:129637-Amphidinium_carterae.1
MLEEGQSQLVAVGGSGLACQENCKTIGAHKLEATAYFEFRDLSENAPESRFGIAFRDSLE